MSDMAIDFGILAGAGASVREIKAGEVIFKEGDAAAEFFVIQSGKVDIQLGNRLLGTLGDHDILGEMALIDDSPRSATVVALTECTVAPIKESQFLFLVRNTPFFALSVIFVWRSFYGMRIRSGEAAKPKAAAKIEAKPATESESAA